MKRHSIFWAAGMIEAAMPRWLRLPPHIETYPVQEGATFGKDGYVLAASSEWWDDYTKVAQATYPVRWFLNHNLPLFLNRWHRRLLHDPWWKLQHTLNPRYRYHVLPTGLSPGYYDPDTQLLHATMEAVTKFVEVAGPQVNWDSDPAHAEAWRVFTEAAKFWPRYQAFKDADDRGEVDDLNAEAAWETEANHHLAQVMLHRGFLWYP